MRAVPRRQAGPNERRRFVQFVRFLFIVKFFAIVQKSPPGWELFLPRISNSGAALLVAEEAIVAHDEPSNLFMTQTVRRVKAHLQRINA